MKHNFRKLDIWLNSMTLVKDVYSLLSEIPIEERFGLKSQISRSSISIPSNIAEGSGRSTVKDFSHFLSISLGSAFELETQLILIQELFEINTEGIVEKCQNLQRMISGFKQKINQ